MRRREALQLAAAAALQIARPSPAVAQPSPLSPSEIRELADSAYTFAYPLVLMEFTRQGSPNNVFTHAREFPSPSTRKVVRPNADTLYSSAWLDLFREPIVLHVPDTAGRYYVIQFLDAWTETFAMPGKRTTGTQEGRFAIVGPNWRGKLPSELHKIDAPTNMVWLIGRTQTNTAADYANVHRIQDGFTFTPLSRYPGPPSAAVPDPVAAKKSLTPPARVAQLSVADFFNQFLELLPRNPPHSADAPMVANLARLGLVPGKSFHPDRLGADGMKALEEGVRAAAARMDDITLGETRNGWSGFGQRIGDYGVDYRTRARIARTGLGALPPEEAIYLGCKADRDGHPLTGANRYRLHFPPNGLPPVRAFWSVTLYDPDGYFSENPLGRYAIGDRDALVRNPDGSLDLYIQHDAPGGSKDRNWLPAPAGGFNLNMRIYWPKEEMVKGAWTPPPLDTRR